MRARVVVMLVSLIAASASCERERSDQSRAQGTVVQAGTPARAAPDFNAPLSSAELAVFDTLPSAMLDSSLTRTAPQIALGRRLYHETVLSNGHDVSCNSCHALNGYGADGRRVSFGSVGHTGGRNSPSVYNAAGQIAQFWDGRAANVEEQAKGPILNPVEMGMPDAEGVLAHMRASATYRKAFHDAFPGEAQPITYDNVGRAIGAFERGLVTPSRWDRYLAGDRSALTPREQDGLRTFVRTGCAACHSGPYVGGRVYAKLGAVKPWPGVTDSGRVRVTHQASDLFVFKVPSLRNVEMTGPYLHDGSVASLDSVIRMMARHQLGKELTDTQVTGIRTWLGSLTGRLPAAYIAQPQLPAESR